MLNKMQVITERYPMFELPIVGRDSGYIVKDIEGLDPSDATIISTTLALMDGEEYQASRGAKRDIIIKLGYSLNSTLTVLERRRELYKYFMPKTKVKLRFFMSGMPAVDIDGWVETFRAPMFTADPSATISISCLKPEFYTQELTLHDGYSTNTPEAQAIAYRGSLETGFTFTLLVNRALSNFSINHNFSNGEGTMLSYAGALMAGDVIEINTREGDKGAYLTRNGVTQSVLYAISPNSDWLQMYPGQNTLRVYAEGQPIPYTIVYSERYGGL